MRRRIKNHDLPPYCRPKRSEIALLWSGRVVALLWATGVLLVTLYPSNHGALEVISKKIIITALILGPTIATFQWPRIAAAGFVGLSVLIFAISAPTAFWGDDTYGVARLTALFIAPPPLIAGGLLFVSTLGPAKRRKIADRTA